MADPHDSRSEDAKAAGLGVLPQEVLEAICKYLSVRDVAAWRAANKELLLKLDKMFIKFTFRTVEILLWREHLVLLANLATSRFAPSVKYVHFRSFYTWLAPRLDDRVSFAERILEPGDILRHFGQSGDDLGRLVQALSGFKNLLGLEVEATTNRALRKRLALTRPKTRSRVETLKNLSVPFHLYALRIVLEAAGELQIRGQNVRELAAGALSAAFLRMTTGGKVVARWLVSLEAVDLAFEVPWGAGGNETSAATLGLFLHSTVNLKRLTLSFWHLAEDWLSTAFNTVHLQQLQELCLRAVRRVDFRQLEAFLDRHKSTLQILELQHVTFTNHALADLFSGVFTSGELHLHSVKFQQLCSATKGLLLFGTSGDLSCQSCDEDLLATWANEIGPGCEHATIAASGSERSTKEELMRTKEMYTLPWSKCTS